MDHAKGLRLFRAGEGKTYRLDRLTLTFKHDDARDPCEYSVCRAVSEPGWPGARLHRHGYEEWHIQLEGESECQLGHDSFSLAPGDMFYVPSGVPHGIKPTGTAACQLLISAPPGVFEGFVAEMAALQSGQPAPGMKADVAWILEKYGIEFLGPSWA